MFIENSWLTALHSQMGSVEAKNGSTYVKHTILGRKKDTENCLYCGINKPEINLVSRLLFLLESTHRQTITLNTADQRLSDFYVACTMIL